MPDFRDIGQKSKEAIGIDKLSFGQVENAKRKPLEEHTGRFPANTILTYDQVTWEEVCGGFPDTNSKSRIGKSASPRSEDGVFNRDNCGFNDTEYYVGKEVGYNDSGSACRYFYCAKASKKDRDEGCERLDDGILRRMRPDKDDSNPTGLNKEGRFAPVVRKNTHPTVKPTELMQYLVRLVTPKGETILDPFMGSGSTGKAVMYENKERGAEYSFVGIEMEPEYCDIARARIEFAGGTNE